MIVPRWEWRTFGQEFGDADSALAALPVEQVVESTELYIVSASGTDVVKVRDELMDVKQLQQVSDDGLEQWTPVLKATFPISASELSAVSAALGVTTVPPARDDYPLAVLLDDVVAPHAELMAIEVHKRRVRHRSGLPGGAHRGAHRPSLHAHHRDRVRGPGPGHGGVAEVGLGGQPNVSFGRGLKVLEGFGQGASRSSTWAPTR